MIDAELQKELRRRYNPDGSNLRKRQLRMLEILDYVDRVCNENGIIYWLSSGTCLGAVRHGGFIPWDDDLDIELLEKDYKRLLTAITADKDCPYILHNHRSDKNFVLPFSKLRDPNSILNEENGLDKDFKYRGIYIDIFPLIPSGQKWCSAVGKKLMLVCIYLTKIKNQKIKSALRKGLYNFLDSVIFPTLRSITRLKSKDQLRHQIGNPFLKARFYNDIFPLKRLDFEGRSFPIPRDPDAYLTKLYNDYNRLPDLNSIKSHSSNVEIKT